MTESKEAKRSIRIALTCAALAVIVGGFMERAKNDRERDRNAAPRGIMSEIASDSRMKSPLAPQTDTAHDMGMALKLSPKLAAIVTNPDSLCPQCARCLQPCTSTPHTKLQCTDPLVAELKATPNVWEVWCMQGKVEVRQPGKWPPPESGDGASMKRTIAAAKDGDPVYATPVSAPEICDSRPLDDPTLGKCGWYRTVKGDYYETAGTVGKPAKWQPVTPGDWHLAIGHVITHTRLVDCSYTTGITAAVAKNNNVFCSDGSFLWRINARDSGMDWQTLQATHDGIWDAIP